MPSRSRSTRLALGAAVAGLGAAAVWFLLPSDGKAAGEQMVEPIPIAWARMLEAAKIAAEQRGVDLLLWFRNLELERTDRVGELFEDSAARAALEQQFVVLELAHDATIDPHELPPAFASLCQVGYGTGGRIAIMPAIVLADAGARPFAVPRTYQQGDRAAWVAELLEYIAMRERRDAAFAVAARTQGVERAKALAEGLEAMERGLVVTCYRAELQAIVDLDADGSAGLRAPHAKLLREGRLLQGALEVHEIGLANREGIDPRRLRTLLEPVVQRYADLPEVDQLARCYQAAAEARLALDERDFARIASDLEAARRLAPRSAVMPRIEQALDLLETRRERAQRGK